MAVLAVLTVLAVLESTLSSCCLSSKIQHNVATVAVLAVSAVVAVSVVTATPLKPNPPFFGQKRKDPPLDVQEINGVQEIPSQKRSRHPKCLF